MSEIEIIPDGGRRRRWPAAEKLRIVEGAVGRFGRLEERIRELERQLGRKTLEVEILKKALDKTRSKIGRGSRSRSQGRRFPVKVAAETWASLDPTSMPG